VILEIRWFMGYAGSGGFSHESRAIEQPPARLRTRKLVHRPILLKAGLDESLSIAAGARGVGGLVLMDLAPKLWQMVKKR